MNTPHPMDFDNPVFCAIDTPDQARARDLVSALRGAVGGIKLGMEFFYANGPQGYRAVHDLGLPVFLDLKFHDIPNTVAGAMASLKGLAPAILTVHAGGGEAMMRAAAAAAAMFEGRRPLVVAVTVLTSLDAGDLEAMGVGDDPSGQALRLAALARSAGLDGVVCSAHEIEAIRRLCGPDFKLVVPGLRAQDDCRGDQKRVMSPRAAHDLGADVLVVGRPITASDDPVSAAREIVASLEVEA